MTSEYAPSAPGARPTRIIVVRYGSAAAALVALKTFTLAYLPEAVKGSTPPRRAGLQPQDSSPAPNGAVRTEHGWVAWFVKGPGLAIVLDAEEGGAARTLAERAVSAIPPRGTGLM